MEEIKQTLQDQKKRYLSILAKNDPDSLRKEIRELDVQTLKEGFWTDQENAKKISKQLADKQKQLEQVQNLELRIQNALEISDESSMEAELTKEIKEIEKIL